MAVDSALLDAAAREEVGPVLRCYEWSPPCVSLGRFQGVEGIDLHYLRDREWELVRRPTGGRAVLHHRELTYALVLPPSVLRGVGIRSSYALLVDWLNGGLSGLLPVTERPDVPPACTARASGVANCFALAGECDTLVRDGKLVGSAQVRRQGALLQHGSILLDAEPEAWRALFGTAGRLVTLRQLRGREVAPDEGAAAVIGGFADMGVRFRSAPLPNAVRSAAAALQHPLETVLPV